MGKVVLIRNEVHHYAFKYGVVIGDKGGHLTVAYLRSHPSTEVDVLNHMKGEIKPESDVY